MGELGGECSGSRTIRASFGELAGAAQRLQLTIHGYLAELMAECGRSSGIDW